MLIVASISVGYFVMTRDVHTLNNDRNEGTKYNKESLNERIESLTNYLKRHKAKEIISAFQKFLESGDNKVQKIEDYFRKLMLKYTYSNPLVQVEPNASSTSFLVKVAKLTDRENEKGLVPKCEVEFLSNTGQQMVYKVDIRVESNAAIQLSDTGYGLQNLGETAAGFFNFIKVDMSGITA